MSDEDEDLEEKFSDPDPSDFHGQKRDLLKRGVEEGELSWEEITEAFPEEHLSETEMEVFLFTCENMGIDVTGDPPNTED